MLKRVRRKGSATGSSRAIQRPAIDRRLADAAALFLVGLVVAFATGAWAVGGVFAALLVLTYVAALSGDTG